MFWKTFSAIIAVIILSLDCGCSQQADEITALSDRVAKLNIQRKDYTLAKALTDKQKVIDQNSATIVDLKKHLQDKQAISDQLAAAMEENRSLTEKVVQLTGTRDENDRLKQEISRLQQDVTEKSALLETLPGASQLEAIQAQLASLQTQISEGGQP